MSVDPRRNGSNEWHDEEPKIERKGRNDTDEPSQAIKKVCHAFETHLGTSDDSITTVEDGDAWPGLLLKEQDSEAELAATETSQLNDNEIHSLFSEIKKLGLSAKNMLSRIEKLRHELARIRREGQSRRDGEEFDIEEQISLRSMVYSVSSGVYASEKFLEAFQEHVDLGNMKTYDTLLGQEISYVREWISTKVRLT